MRENREKNRFYENVEPRYYQIRVEEALNFNMVDLFKDEGEGGNKLLSRADLLLIFTIFKGGIEEFLNEYKKYVIEEKDKKGYVVVQKPHFFLKNLLG